MTVEAIIVLGIAAVCCILLTNRFNLIGPVRCGRFIHPGHGRGLPLPHDRPGDLRDRPQHRGQRSERHDIERDHPVRAVHRSGRGRGPALGPDLHDAPAPHHRLDNDPLLAVLCTIVSPFVAYFAAEELHGSGVLAVVTAGVVSSWRGVGTDMVHLRAFGRPFWTVTTFLLNTILFLMVGVSLPGIISGIPQATLTRALILIPAIYVAMVLARFVGHHSIIFAIRALDRRPQQRERRTNFRSRLVTTVAGFRGAISLAMAVSIPLAFGDSVYEERDIIILVVAGVTLLSLIIQGIALPVVVRWAAQAPTPFLEMNARAEAGETQVVGATVRDLIEEIDSLASSVDVTDADTIERVRADYLQRMHNLMMSGDFREYRAYAPDELRLRLACVSFLRNAAFEQRHAGNIDDSSFEYIRDSLDIETRHIEGPLEVE